MKAKHTILLIALGFSLDYLSSWFKSGQTLLLIATILKVAGILLLAYKVITYDGFRRFMER
ncbi:MAG: hypothetical protein M3Q06_06470 [Bacteroidota bacterium]|nr:hypothetical protein [Bacteroidota bacterium]